MQDRLFDKEIISNQLSVLNNTLADQRQSKKTLLSHLEKFSNAMYENFNSDNTDSLLSLINEAHSVFESIKSNINKTIELKKFLENIYNSEHLNPIETEKFSNDFNTLLDNISKTNSSYLTFMNNYEAFITTPTSIKKTEIAEEDLSEESLPDNIVDSFNQDEEESLFDTLNAQETSNFQTDIEDTDNIENKASSEEVLEETVTEIIPELETKTEEILTEDIEKETSTLEVTEEITENNVVETLKETGKETVEETQEAITPLPEKELIIDNNLGIAILPYSISDLDEVFLDDPENYSSIQDIIDKEYTVKLKDFENTSIIRYKEAFKLAKEKSNYTFSQAATFAKKFLVENEISSLIIASCKNVDELEFYIECLNNNNLNNFHYFKIIEK